MKDKIFALGALAVVGLGSAGLVQSQTPPSLTANLQSGIAIPVEIRGPDPLPVSISGPIVNIPVPLPVISHPQPTRTCHLMQGVSVASFCVPGDVIVINPNVLTNLPANNLVNNSMAAIIGAYCNIDRGIHIVEGAAICVFQPRAYTVAGTIRP